MCDAWDLAHRRDSLGGDVSCRLDQEYAAAVVLMSGSHLEAGIWMASLEGSEPFL